MTTQNRQPEGIPTGGQYAATAHSEGTITLAGPAAPRPELAGYDIPAPLEGQKFLDGTPITATTFEEAYEEFLRPLEEFEAAHGPWRTTRVTDEDALLQLAGIREWKLGNVRGVFLETDEETGDPVIAVATRNGGYCCTNDCDGTCDPCIQDEMGTLPTFVRSESEDGDVTNYFRVADPAAAARIATDEKTRKVLNHRLFARDAISSGKQPPWAILTPVRPGKERQQLEYKTRTDRSLLNRNANDQRYAMLLISAVDAGKALPTPVSVHGLFDRAGYAIYGEAVTKHTAEAARLRDAGVILAEERKLPLPPAIAAIAAAEADRLAAAIVQEDTRLADSRARLEKSMDSIRSWAGRRLEHAAALETTLQKSEAALAAFDWSSSWPGDPADCPPKRSAE